MLNLKKIVLFLGLVSLACVGEAEATWPWLCCCSADEGPHKRPPVQPAPSGPSAARNDAPASPFSTAVHEPSTSGGMQTSDALRLAASALRPLESAEPIKPLDSNGQAGRKAFTEDDSGTASSSVQEIAVKEPLSERAIRQVSIDPFGGLYYAYGECLDTAIIYYPASEPVEVDSRGGKCSLSVPLTEDRVRAVMSEHDNKFPILGVATHMGYRETHVWLVGVITPDEMEKALDSGTLNLEIVSIIQQKSPNRFVEALCDRITIPPKQRKGKNITFLVPADARDTPLDWTRRYSQLANVFAMYNFPSSLMGDDVEGRETESTMPIVPSGLAKDLRKERESSLPVSAAP